MKKKDDEVPIKKERHLVSWSQEEDDILREQIRLHGTESWTIIASNFTDKSSRQCRRRWFAYLNSDCKRGGWSHEEDLLLCEAQRLYGNRWTEIAKVVPGRTDNAVKNRFNTLCKKRAKEESTTSKENSCINLNSKTDIFSNGLNADAYKKMRTSIENKGEAHHLHRNPLTVLAQNGDVKPTEEDDSKKTQGMFLKKDDPKVLALIQQEQLLNSLATKVNSESLNQKSKELDSDLRSSNGGSRSSWRKSDTYRSSPAGSEYSTESTYVSCVKMKESAHTQIGVPQQDTGHEVKDTDGPSFDSPMHVTPLFRSLAAAVPSPKFSESEKHFLLKTFGMESSPSSTIKSTVPSQSPSCKRSLLHLL